MQFLSHFMQLCASASLVIFAFVGQSGAKAIFGISDQLSRTNIPSAVYSADSGFKGYESEDARKPYINNVVGGSDHDRHGRASDSRVGQDDARDFGIRYAGYPGDITFDTGYGEIVTRYKRSNQLDARGISDAYFNESGRTGYDFTGSSKIDTGDNENTQSTSIAYGDVRNPGSGYDTTNFSGKEDARNSGQSSNSGIGSTHDNREGFVGVIEDRGAGELPGPSDISRSDADEYRRSFRANPDFYKDFFKYPIIYLKSKDGEVDENYGRNNAGVDGYEGSRASYGEKENIVYGKSTFGEDIPSYGTDTRDSNEAIAVFRPSDKNNELGQTEAKNNDVIPDAQFQEIIQGIQ